MNCNSSQSVVADNTGLLSFAQLDRERGFVPVSHTTDHNYQPAAWEQWYDSIYETAFQELTDEDYSRITNNGWNPEYFVPLSLDRLEVNPFAGFYHDGQLLENIGTIYKQYLNDNPYLLNRYCHILNLALYQLHTNGDHLDDADCTVLQGGTTVFDDTHDRLVEVQSNLSCH